MNFAESSSRSHLIMREPGFNRPGFSNFKEVDNMFKTIGAIILYCFMITVIYETGHYFISRRLGLHYALLINQSIASSDFMAHVFPILFADFKCPLFIACITPIGVISANNESV